MESIVGMFVLMGNWKSQTRIIMQLPPNGIVLTACERITYIAYCVWCGTTYLTKHGCLGLKQKMYFKRCVFEIMNGYVP